MSWYLRVVEHGLGVSIHEQTVERKAPAFEVIEDHADSFGLSDLVVLAFGVVDEVLGVVLGAAGVVEGALGVVLGEAGVVDGALGVVLGVAGVVEGAFVAAGVVDGAVV